MIDKQVGHKLFCGLASKLLLACTENHGNSVGRQTDLTRGAIMVASHPKFRFHFRPSHSSRLNRAEKTLVLAGLVLFGEVPAAVPAQVYLPHQSAVRGGSVLIPVAFTVEAGAVAGLQFDLQYDNSSLSLSATVGDAARASGKRVYLADVTPNQKRFVLAGLNRNVIADGTLINLFLNVDQNAPDGLYPLTLSHLVAADPDGRSVPLSGADGAVTVGNTGADTGPLQAAGVLNAASLVPGPVAPGELITLMGSGIGSVLLDSGPSLNTPLPATAVLFDGIQAPLLYVAANQVNAVVPFGISGKTTTQVRVTLEDRLIAELPLPVAASAPAIFTLDSTGVGPGAILNQDSTLNSPVNPAQKGSIVALFATGAGQTDPPGIDGSIAGDVLPRPLLPVSVRIGDVDAEVMYAGAAPGMVAGVMQVNCVVPSTTPSGYAIPVVLAVGERSSQQGVTLSIR